MEIHFLKNENTINLTITDDGEGLIRTAGSDNPQKGTGLKAIRNLIGNSGGTLKMGRGSNGWGLSLEIVWRMEYSDPEISEVS